MRKSISLGGSRSFCSALAPPQHGIADEVDQDGETVRIDREEPAVEAVPYADASHRMAACKDLKTGAAAEPSLEPLALP